MVDWGGGAKGAAGGAAAGAAFGPYGAAVGGVVGGLAGLLGGGDDNQTLSDYQKAVLSRGVPQIGADQMGQASTSGFRNNQSLLLGRLEDMSAGRGPSAAAMQAQATADRAIGQQAGFSQSGRGNATLANIVAANRIGDIGGQASQAAALGRLQEAQGANQMLLQGYGQARQQDEQTSMFNAQQQNYIAEANLTAKLKALGLGDEAIQAIINAQMKQAQMPTLGDQILAGGSSLGALAASQRAQSNAGSGTTVGTLSQMYPHGGGGDNSGPITHPSQF